VKPDGTIEVFENDQEEEADTEELMHTHMKSSSDSKSKKRNKRIAKHKHADDWGKKGTSRNEKKSKQHLHQRNSIMETSKSKTKTTKRADPSASPGLESKQGESLKTETPPAAPQPGNGGPNPAALSSDDEQTKAAVEAAEQTEAPNDVIDEEEQQLTETEATTPAPPPVSTDGKPNRSEPKLIFSSSISNGDTLSKILADHPDINRDELASLLGVDIDTIENDGTITTKDLVVKVLDEVIKKRELKKVDETLTEALSSKEEAEKALTETKMALRSVKSYLNQTIKAEQKVKYKETETLEAIYKRNETEEILKTINQYIDEVKYAAANAQKQADVADQQKVITSNAAVKAEEALDQVKKAAEAIGRSSASDAAELKEKIKTIKTTSTFIRHTQITVDKLNDEVKRLANQASREADDAKESFKRSSIIAKETRNAFQHKQQIESAAIEAAKVKTEAIIKQASDKAIGIIEEAEKKAAIIDDGGGHHSKYSSSVSLVENGEIDEDDMVDREID